MKVLFFWTSSLHLRHVIRPTAPVIFQAIRGRSSTTAPRRDAGRFFKKDSPAKRPFSPIPQQTSWPDPPKPLSAEELRSQLASRVQRWSGAPHVRKRVSSFGFKSGHVEPALSSFAGALLDGGVWETLQYQEDMLARLGTDLADTTDGSSYDIALTKLFFEWASHPTSEVALLKVMPLSTILHIRELSRTADMSNPLSSYPEARVAPPRKVIMHVGPTNSGKTHNALRALAAAKRGCYAGPLRLLAHEIYSRLNNGQIVPLGEDPGIAEPDPETNIEATDAEGRAIVRKEGDKRFVRPCNLITGEEQIVVGENVGLSSCTVEMVPLLPTYDVAVVDEIQMLADPQRGGAWTGAVLGIKAVELHLCGEEAAVPLVKAMLQASGDELIVKKYERLTPLTIAATSLGGDLKAVQKGDCVVAFSRTSIFQLKGEIEKSTGLNCAVVYGGLPAEVRNEQAHLFNDPKSGYDVIVGSDAIGMGLNLKIKRVVFAGVSKSDGKRDVLLSAPQIKQIAGRAGRFGLHGDDDGGGVATTLYDSDLPVLRKAMTRPVEPLRLARIRVGKGDHKLLTQALPPSASTSMPFDIVQYVSRMGPLYTHEETTAMVKALQAIEQATNGLSDVETMVLMEAPIPSRDEVAASCMQRFGIHLSRSVHVDLKKVLQEVGLWAHLETALNAEKEGRLTQQVVQSLRSLEIMHKVLVAYLWLTLRLPAGFSDRQLCLEIKHTTEKSIEWILRGLTKVKHDSLSSLLPRRWDQKLTSTNSDKKRSRPFGKLSAHKNPARPEAQ